MGFRVACSNCYREQSWSGRLSDEACGHCGRPIPIESTARALVHLFSCAVHDLQHDEPVDEAGDDVLRWLVGMSWGHAMSGGRRNWVDVGCPITAQDFCDAIKSANASMSGSLRALLCGLRTPDAIASRTEEIAAAVVQRLESFVSDENKTYDPLDPPSVTREYLYDILSTFPSPIAVPVLEKLQAPNTTRRDSDAESVVGAALVRAIKNCRAVAT